MKISVHYRTGPNREVYISGNIDELGAWDEAKAVPMQSVSESWWEWSRDIQPAQVQYSFLIVEGGCVVRREWGKPHQILPLAGKNCSIIDLWQDAPRQPYLYSAPFTEVFYAHRKHSGQADDTAAILLDIDCPYVKKGEKLCVVGASPKLGEWDVARALPLDPLGKARWQLKLDASELDGPTEYKPVLRDETTGKCVHWEEGDNRLLLPLSAEEYLRVERTVYRHPDVFWKGAGVSIPVFSLRSDESFGVGDFSDLKKMVDWAVAANLKIIQLLPVNDTVSTHTRRDSYPYSAVSVYALHPLYLGLHSYPLRNRQRQEEFQKEARRLNRLDSVDYEGVMKLKTEYLNLLYAECGEDVLAGDEFKSFSGHNQKWLFPYACYSYLREARHTSDHTQWGDYRIYDAQKLEDLIRHDAEAGKSFQQACFVQFLLHRQLTEARDYAHRCGVALKGDIPIGVDRNSVDVWIEPELFHTGMQTGAPPDDFSVYGQNWGFPTYNWEMMARTDYRWWVNRLRKMSDYFDAYRIDHILGFFRIWEIPVSSVQGLLGHFSPSFPLTGDEIRQWGIDFDVASMTLPCIDKSLLHDIFGEDALEVETLYLHQTADGLYRLHSSCETQLQVKEMFEGKNDPRSNRIREGLYRLCNEVLFVPDRQYENRYHPRIAARSTHICARLDHRTREAFNRLYDHFYYHLHSLFWKAKALEKLPAPLQATSMLACGEDLGMIPPSVPEVMDELKILSLEIERMPKKTGTFSDLSTVPFLSVCTTSTHDMSPIRGWWKENREKTRDYFNRVLRRTGEPPVECTPEICRQIIGEHLHSPAMLVIIPLQDWLSMDDRLRNPDPDAERINIPSDPNHYWRYRMHLKLEDLINERQFNHLIRQMVAFRVNGNTE
jgi:4-alpha-glucanotransferase